MMNPDELAEARIFALAAPVILPLIERRRKSAYESLIREHKAGRTDNVAIVAQLAVLWDLEHDITSKQAIYTSTMEKQK